MFQSRLWTLFFKKKETKKQILHLRRNRAKKDKVSHKSRNWINLSRSLNHLKISRQQIVSFKLKTPLNRNKKGNSKKK